MNDEIWRRPAPGSPAPRDVAAPVWTPPPPPGAVDAAPPAQAGEPSGRGPDAPGRRVAPRVVAVVALTAAAAVGGAVLLTSNDGAAPDEAASTTPLTTASDTTTTVPATTQAPTTTGPSPATSPVPSTAPDTVPDTSPPVTAALPTYAPAPVDGAPVADLTAAVSALRTDPALSVTTSFQSAEGGRLLEFYAVEARSDLANERDLIAVTERDVVIFESIFDWVTYTVYDRAAKDKRWLATRPGPSELMGAWAGLARDYTRGMFSSELLARGDVVAESDDWVSLDDGTSAQWYDVRVNGVLIGQQSALGQFVDVDVVPDLTFRVFVRGDATVAEVAAALPAIDDQPSILMIQRFERTTEAVVVQVPAPEDTIDS